jgi:hypothetical protein
VLHERKQSLEHTKIIFLVGPQGQGYFLKNSKALKNAHSGKACQNRLAVCASTTKGQHQITPDVRRQAAEKLTAEVVRHLADFSQTPTSHFQST